MSHCVKSARICSSTRSSLWQLWFSTPAETRKPIISAASATTACLTTKALISTFLSVWTSTRVIWKQKWQVKFTRALAGSKTSTRCLGRKLAASRKARVKPYRTPQLRLNWTIWAGCLVTTLRQRQSRRSIARHPLGSKAWGVQERIRRARAARQKWKAMHGSIACGKFTLLRALLRDRNQPLTSWREWSGSRWVRG